MLQHGYAPKHFMMSTIVPIPKGMKSNLKCSENYRPIAISSLVCNVFDKIIISIINSFTWHYHVQESNNYIGLGISITSKQIYLEDIIIYYYNNNFYNIVKQL